jgi:hypothetical protein
LVFPAVVALPEVEAVYSFFLAPTPSFFSTSGRIASIGLYASRFDSQTLMDLLMSLGVEVNGRLSTVRGGGEEKLSPLKGKGTQSGDAVRLFNVACADGLGVRSNSALRTIGRLAQLKTGSNDPGDVISKPTN